MNHNRATLIEAIALKETHLARLDAERQALLDGLNDLRQQLSAIDVAASPAKETSTLSSAAKITLFRSLFKGREDVYPKLWISKSGDRKGYMPACANDGNYSLCGKRKFPRVKCGDCNHQAYLPVSDEVIRDHLQGKQTIGVYPLLPDDTCRFLAVDFDKTTWQEDVAAFRETCSSLDIPVAVERSRSGNGAHAWFFFTKPVMATVARVMGCFLITETMSRRHQLSMESYDRLFPSQDTMPRGGFGNLIGLTATPYRRDGHQPIIHLQCGPTRFSLNRKQQATDEDFTRRLILRETGFSLSDTDSGITIQEIYARLTSDRQRNHLILGDIRQALAEGRSPILLTERKDHLEFLAGELRDTVKHLVVLHGGMGVKQRRKVMEHLASIPDDEERLILATGRYIGEGFDDARLDTLFLALPFSWKGMLVQYAGRLHRLHPGKVEVQVYDYVDSSVPMLAKMHEKRMKGFKAMGYEQTVTALACPE